MASNNESMTQPSPSSPPPLIPLTHTEKLREGYPIMLHKKLINARNVGEQAKQLAPQSMLGIYLGATIRDRERDKERKREGEKRREW